MGQARRAGQFDPPGIIVKPLAHDELHGERADFYQWMLKTMFASRAGTSDEVAALIMGRKVDSSPAATF